MADPVRVHYQEELEQLEASALGGLELVNTALERTLEAVEHRTSSWRRSSSPTTTASTVATWRCTRR